MSKPVNFRFRDFDIKSYVKNRYKKFQDDFWKPEKKFSEMTIDELRSYTTMFIGFDYSNGTVIKPEMKFEDKRRIVKQLNTEFVRRVGEDFWKLYELYDKDLNTPEKWLGEERFKLFSYHKTDYPYAPMANFIMAYKLYLFAKEKEISIDDIIILFDKFTYAGFWNIDNDETKDAILKSQIIESVMAQDYSENVLEGITEA